MALSKPSIEAFNTFSSFILSNLSKSRAAYVSYASLSSFLKRISSLLDRYLLITLSANSSPFEYQSSPLPFAYNVRIQYATASIYELAKSKISGWLKSKLSKKASILVVRFANRGHRLKIDSNKQMKFLLARPLQGSVPPFQ